MILRNVVVDASKRVCGYLEEMCHVHIAGILPAVVIRSLFAPTRFFKNLFHFPELGGHVWRLAVEGLFPDIVQYELDLFLRHVLPCLASIQVFRWYTDQRPLSTECLLVLPHHARRHGWQLCLQCACFRLHASLMLDLSNFGSDKALAHVDLNLFPAPQRVKVVRYALRTSLPFADVTLANVIRSANAFKCRGIDASLSYIEPLFAPSSDADILLRAVHISSLRQLAIVNCMELGLDTPAHVLLKKLEPALSHLLLLHYDVRTDCRDDSLFSCLSHCTRLQLLVVSLHLHRQNGVVDFTTHMKKTQALSASLLRLELSADFAESQHRPSCNACSQAVCVKSLVALSCLIQLRVLSLPVVLAQLQHLAELLEPLSRLAVLRVTVTTSARQKALHSACLIVQEYFTCPSTFSSAVLDSNEQKYLALATQYRLRLPNLAFVSFDFKMHSLIFDCRFHPKVALKDSTFLDH
ncbi:hypothetical protein METBISCDRAFT_26244 [Metschnikowia bicuspidata]|uniref:F-box domain-containing protein n=1 Tax=Metschnikowia bicuspidata TaxID=27322 RepID=A0A4P9ZH44_9ASCO|nr:hypothetical protein METBISCDRAFT_26244 [Metschnikowia bicuspidata]